MIALADTPLERFGKHQDFDERRGEAAFRRIGLLNRRDGRVEPPPVAAIVRDSMVGVPRLGRAVRGCFHEQGVVLQRPSRAVP